MIGCHHELVTSPVIPVEIQVGFWGRTVERIEIPLE
jgi:hypothetical protein